MALEQRLNLKQTLQLRMTPQLRQAIKILQVSRAELETIVGDELCQNPTLEENESTPAETVETRTGDVEVSETEQVESKTAETETDSSDIREVDWDSYRDRCGSDFHGSIGTGSDRDDNKQQFIENSPDASNDLVHSLVHILYGVVDRSE